MVGFTSRVRVIGCERVKISILVYSRITIFVMVTIFGKLLSISLMSTRKVSSDRLFIAHWFVIVPLVMSIKQMVKYASIMNSISNNIHTWHSNIIAKCVVVKCSGAKPLWNHTNEIASTHYKPHKIECFSKKPTFVWLIQLTPNESKRW